MALETVTHISDLVVTNPASTDPASQGDDHIRNIKRAIKTTFPNITGPVTLTQAELNGIPNAKADKTVTLSGGDGITTAIGDLSANRTISVDNTVVRTAGAQTLAGAKTFSSAVVTTGNAFDVRGDGNTHLWFRDLVGAIRGVIYQDPIAGQVSVVQYNDQGGHAARLAVKVDGKINADIGYFSGSGKGLTELDASNLSTGTVADARLPTTAVRTSRTLTGGDGITTAIGDLSANRTISVDGTVVRTTRTLTGGDGINTIGDLSANRTISVDSTVARRNTANEFAGTITAANGNAVVRATGAAPGGNATIWTQDSDGKNRGLFWTDANGASRMRSYSADRASYKEVALDGTSGNLNISGQYNGSGAGLSALNASNLASGTVPNARMAGSYSWTDLTLAGRLRQTATNAWGTGGLEVAGSIPNIWFNQTDNAMSAMAGVNGTSFYVVNDTDSSGTYDQIALEVPLNDTDLLYFGKALAYQGTAINAGNGLTGGGNLTATRAIALGTPSSITATSTNSVTATSHTHELPEGAVRTLIAQGGFGGLGTYVFAYNSTGAHVGKGVNAAGSSLTPGAESDGARYGNGSLSGTWKCMGDCPAAYGTVWLRVA